MARRGPPAPALSTLLPDLMGLAPDAIITVTSDGAIELWSDGAVATYGFTREEAVGQVPRELLRTRFPESAGAAGAPADPDAEVVRQGRWTGELIQTRKDGTEITVASRWVIQGDRHGAGILRHESDITEQRRAQEDLAFEARRQGALSRFAVTVDVANNTQTEILERAVAAVAAGLPADAASIVMWEPVRGEFVLSASTIAEPAPGEGGGERPRMASATRWIIQHRLPLVIQDVRDDPDGAETTLADQGFVAYAGVPVVLYGEKATGVLYALHRSPPASSDRDLGYLREVALRTAVAISLQRLLEDVQLTNEELKRGRRETESILRSASEGICGLDMAGCFTFVNPAAARLLGYGSAELLGKNAHETIHHTRADGSPYPPTACPVRRTYETGERATDATEVLWRKDGSPVPVEWWATPINEGSAVAGVVLTFRDIAQRKEVDRMKDEFVSVASHELRTPLTSIHGALGLIAGGVFGALPDGADEMIRTALRNAERLGRLVNDLLDLDRMRAGQAPIQRRDVDIAELVRQAADVMGPMAESGGVRLELDVAPCVVAADADRILQVLTNLISNAVKFSPAGQVVRIATEHRGGELIVRVVDHGRGIPADKLDEVFERFQQVNVADARVRGGSGLGLAIAREIVEQHGGRIWAESAPGTGSTFLLALPDRPGGGRA